MDTECLRRMRTRPGTDCVLIADHVIGSGVRIRCRTCSMSNSAIECGILRHQLYFPLRSGRLQGVQSQCELRFFLTEDSARFSQCLSQTRHMSERYTALALLALVFVVGIGSLI